MVGSTRQFFPLLLLIFISALFINSHYRPSLPLSTDNPNPNFTLNINPHRTGTNNLNFKVLIKVLAYNRLNSLSRCLGSLASADYFGDRVDLHVYIDHFVQDNKTIELENKLEDSHKMLGFVDDFIWRFGDKIVHYRTSNIGLQAQWLEAWWPSSDDEFAFVVEDDLEVSPLYYRFLTSLIVNYYYNSSNFSPSIYGASLQRPRFVPGKHGNKIHLDDGTHIFLYQLVGTWGQLLFPKPWKEFRLWYDEHKTKGIKPILDGMVTTGWYKKIGERIWTPWFIKFIHSHGYFNIYTNFQHERALSVSHRDAGVNYGKTAGPDSELLNKNTLNFNFFEMQPLRSLKWYDFCFREIHPERLVRSFSELESLIFSMQKRETVTLVSLYGVSETVTRNLLCHFETLNVWNYILVGPQSDFHVDLARRGHPVIVADQIFQDTEADKLKEIFVKTHVIKKCLESKLNALVVNGNMISNNSNPFRILIDPTYDVYAEKNLEILFVRSSPSAESMWDDNFVKKVAAMTGEAGSFVQTVTKLLELKGTRIKWVNETNIGVKLDGNIGNQWLLNGYNKTVYWSPDIGLDLIHKKLEELGMWNVDSDSSCKAVVCHKS